MGSPFRSVPEESDEESHDSLCLLQPWVRMAGGGAAGPWSGLSILISARDRGSLRPPLKFRLPKNHLLSKNRLLCSLQELVNMIQEIVVSLVGTAKEMSLAGSLAVLAASGQGQGSGLNKEKY